MKRLQIVLSGCCAFLLLLTGCSKETPTAKVEKAGIASIVRLDSLLEDQSTKMLGGIQLNAGNFAAFEGNGWEVKKNFISAINKRITIQLPQPRMNFPKAILKFRARSPENARVRSVSIISGNSQPATLELESEWNDYQTTLSAEGWKTLRFVFHGKKGADGSFADFSNIELQFCGRAYFKMQNEVRPSILFPANSSLSFQVTVPTGKPHMALSASLNVENQDESQEAFFSVRAQTDSSSRTLLDSTASSSQWRDHQIDLTEFAGKQVMLELKSSLKAAGTEARSTPVMELAVWSNPEIYDASAKRGGPNIILFSVDALRWDHLSHYGYPIKTSPNLDELALKSTVFRNAYCTSPSTLPSHTSVMTGLYAAQHHVGRTTRAMDRLQSIPDNLITLAELAMQRNYRTAAITDDGYVSGFYGFQQGFEQYRENNDVDKNEVVSTIDDGIAWLKKNGGRQFFLFLHSYEVHEPFTPPLSAFRHLFPEHKLKSGKSPEIYNEWLKDVMFGKVIPTSEEKELVRKAFDAEIYFFDQQFGRLMKELQNLRLDQNTVIVVFSDHGQQFFERGNSFGHANSLFAEEIRVPLILYIPGKPYQDRKELASLVDIYPTVAALMGAQIAPGVDGFNLMQASGKQFQNRTVYYEINLRDHILWGIQNHEYKLLVDSAEQREYFFDLQKDPGETRNLSDLSPRTMKIMKDLLSSYIARSTAPPRFRDSVPEKEEAAELNERLRALGYLN